MILPFACSSQTWRLPVASPGWGAIGYSRQFFDLAATRANVATLTNFKTMSGSIYGERAFLLSPAQTLLGIAAAPALSGVLAISFSVAGYSDFHEYDVGFGYAKNLGSNLSAGIRCGYYSLYIPGYFNAGAIESEIGLLCKPVERVSIGMQICNPFGARLGSKGDERLAMQSSFAFGYDFSPTFYMGFIIQKTRGQPPDVHLIWHYQPLPVFGFEAGLETVRDMVWFAPVFQFSKIQLRVNVSHHPTLGFSQGLGLFCRIKKERRQHTNGNENGERLGL